jgi:hypothetical protein
MEKDPNSVWSLLQQLKNTESDHKTNAPKITGNKWITHLEDLLSQNAALSQNKNIPDISKSTLPIEQNPLLDLPITSAELLMAIKRLKPKKSPGKDNITNELIKACIPKMSSTIVSLFNRIVQSGIYPDSWKQGINIPIFKSGDQFNPSNYRGITLNNAMANLFCQLINNRLTNYLENNNLLAEEQAGFRKSCRTQDQVFILQKLIDDTIKNPNKRLYSCFVDFSKAFDNVWHNGLLYKLQNMGVRGNVFRVIQSMYINATVCARTSTGLSKEVPVKKGVLQGNSLSPTLFNIYINDIVKYLQGNDSPYMNDINGKPIPCLMYADDIVILSTSKKGLQAKLNNLDTYCRNWGLNVNREKTKIVVFTKTDPKFPLFFTIGGSIISTTESYKYLGVVLHKNGDTRLGQEHLKRQGTKAIHCFRRSIRENNINVPVMAKLFDTLITPILTFSAEVWLPYSKDLTGSDGDSMIKDLLVKCTTAILPHESVHLKFCKHLLGVHNKAANFPVLAELGRFPITLHIITKLISFWLHIIESHDDSLLKQVYTSMTAQLTQKGQGNKWLTFIRDILESLGFKHVWNNQSTLSPAKLKHSLQEKIKSLYCELWAKRTKENNSKLAFYSSITSQFGFQKYLLLPREHRQAMTKLRISAHDLEVERGRYAGLPRQQRLCRHCGVLEDELHFLDVCPIYHALRHRLQNRLQISCSNLKISSLFSNSDAFGPLAHYVHDCFTLRRETASGS